MCGCVGVWRIKWLLVGRNCKLLYKCHIVVIILTFTSGLFFFFNVKLSKIPFSFVCACVCVCVCLEGIKVYSFIHAWLLVERNCKYCVSGIVTCSHRSNLQCSALLFLDLRIDIITLFLLQP